MIFLNLTNGIEALPEHPGASFVRIPSTMIEKQDWLGLFGGLDDNFLFHLARGAPCTLVDFGTRRETSKTISVGVPCILSVLGHLWLGHSPCSVGEFLGRADTEHKRIVKRKLLYHRRWLNTSEIRLTGVSRATVHDGDVDWYRQVLQASALTPTTPTQQTT